MPSQLACPSEITPRLSREYLQPIDIIRCSRVSREWRTTINSLESRYMLAQSHQTHDAEDDVMELVSRFRGTLQLTRHGELADSPDLKHLEQLLSRTAIMIEAHHFRIPAAALEPFANGRMLYRSTTCQAKLAGQYFLRLFNTSIQIIDLSCGKVFSSPGRVAGLNISQVALTSQCFANTYEGPGDVRLSFVVGGQETNVSFKSDLYDTDEIQLGQGVKALAGQGTRFMAVKEMTKQGRQRYGILLMEDWLCPRLIFADLPRGDLADAVLDGQHCVLFLADSWRWVRVTIARISLEDGSITVMNEIDYHRDIGDAFDITRTGKTDQDLVKPSKMVLLLDLRTLDSSSIGLDADDAMWRDTAYGYQNCAVVATVPGIWPISRIWHYLMLCDEPCQTLVNESFIVVWHGVRQCTRGCSGYHAFCFDSTMQTRNLPARHLFRWRRRL